MSSDYPYTSKRNLKIVVWECSPVVEHFPSMLMFLAAIPSTTKTNSSTSNKIKGQTLCCRPVSLNNFTTTLSYNKK